MHMCLVLLLLSQLLPVITRFANHTKPDVDLTFLKIRNLHRDGSGGSGGSGRDLSEDSYPVVLPAFKYVVLEISDDTLHYLVPLRVGTPAQVVKVILDTGSSEMILFNQSYCLAHDTHTHDCYNNYASSTYAPEIVRVKGANNEFDGDYTLAGVLNGRVYYQTETEPPKYVYRRPNQWCIGGTLATPPMYAVNSNAKHPFSVDRLTKWQFGLNGSEVDVRVVDARKTSSMSLSIDNEYVSDHLTMSCNDIVEVETTLVGTTAPGYAKQRISMSLSENFDYGTNYWHRFPNSDGLMGLAFSSLPQGSRIVPPLHLLMEGEETTTLPFLPTFSLDFNGPDLSSRLWLGGVEAKYQDRIVWSKPPALPNTNQDIHRVWFESMEICGQDVFANMTEIGWGGIIDTGASCLTLPEQMYDVVVNNIPVNCESHSRSASGVREPWTDCFLSRESLDLLPTISFTFSKGGPKLHLRLSDLIVELGDIPHHRRTPAKQLCLTRGSKIHDVVTESVGKVPEYLSISFGTRTLRSLFTVFDMEHNQVGMANKDWNQNVSTTQCLQSKQCVGMQGWWEAYNMCMNPICENYYFLKFDNTTKSCVLSAAFQVCAFFLVATFLTVEVGLNEVHTWLGSRVPH